MNSRGTDNGLREEASMPDDFPAELKEILGLILGSVLAGVLTGFFGVFFLSCLRWGGWAFEKYTAMLKVLPGSSGLAVLAFTTGICTMLAAWLVKRFAPNAGGSGVPYVERILRSTEVPIHRHVLPVKFLGGLLALCPGLLLGCEGPLVQMGAVVGESIGRMLKGTGNIWKPLMAAGAVSGLAAGFNAPVAGTVFLLEEVLKKTTPLGFLLASSASLSAVFILNGVFGIGRDFSVSEITVGPVWNLPLFLVFGAFAGWMGVWHNKFLLFLIKPQGIVARTPVLPRAMIIGALVGIFSWFLPSTTGEGDHLTQWLLGGGAVSGGLIMVLAIRFFLGPLSYAAGTPGGFFTPLVALGALSGAIVGNAFHGFFPLLVPSPMAFVVVGVAALVTASVRAPITGIVICVEMTGRFELFVPLLATSLGAFLVPTLLRNEPIYDSLARPAVKP